MSEKAKGVIQTICLLALLCVFVLCLVETYFYESIGTTASSWLWVFWFSCAAEGVLLFPFFLKMPCAMSERNTILRERASHALDDIISRGITSEFFESFPARGNRGIYEQYKAGTLLSGIDGKSWVSYLISSATTLFGTFEFAEKIDARMTSSMWLETFGIGIGAEVLIWIIAAVAGCFLIKKRSFEAKAFLCEAASFLGKSKTDGKKSVSAPRKRNSLKGSGRSRR